MAKMNHHSQKIVRAIARTMIPFYTLLSSTSGSASVPHSAKVIQILGPNDLVIRRGGQIEPVSIGTLLRRGEQLFMSGSNRTFTQLDFYNSSNQHLNLAVQTSTKNNLSTLYYHPCTVRNGDASVIEWLNQAGGRRGCERGVRIRPGQRLRSGALFPETEQLYAFRLLEQAQLAQASRRRFQDYCTVLADSGQGWIGISSSNDPCENPLQQCRESGGQNCTAVTLDRWGLREPELTAVVACANNREFKANGTGSTMNEVANTLWTQAQAEGATSCALRVLGAKDVIALPLPSGEPTLVQARNTEPCPTLEVFSGSAMARSGKRPEGVALEAGQRYIYCGEDGEEKIETFDPTVESIELQVLKAPERGYQLCDKEQASGGQEGNRRTIQLTATEGEMRISYDMYDVPDRLQVLHEGRTLIDTDFVSGTNTVSVPFQGNVGHVEVILTGNPEIPSTRWEYTLSCPQ